MTGALSNLPVFNMNINCQFRELIRYTWWLKTTIRYESLDILSMRIVEENKIKRLIFVVLEYFWVKQITINWWHFGLNFFNIHLVLSVFAVGAIFRFTISDVSKIWNNYAKRVRAVHKLWLHCSNFESVLTNNNKYVYISIHIYHPAINK